MNFHVASRGSPLPLALNSSNKIIKNVPLPLVFFINQTLILIFSVLIFASAKVILFLWFLKFTTFIILIEIQN